jgi:hypothetical protein
MRSVAFACVIVGAIGPTSSAQIIRQPTRAPAPKAWASLSVGLMDVSWVHDGSTESDWRFGNTVAYRISLEMPIQNQSTIGISGSFARAPLTYVPLGVVAPAGCPNSCDADATVTQLVATFHAGRNAIGFQQLIDISLGATGYSSFRARSTGVKLPPTQLDADLLAGIGYGFGYAFSPDMQITLVQEGFLSVHQRTGLAGDENTLGRQFVLRFGTRFGF